MMYRNSLNVYCMKNVSIKIVLSFVLFLFISQAANVIYAQNTAKTVEQWVVLAKKGEKKLMNANLTGANLEGVSLVGVNLSGANLTGANLASANLSNSDFYQCNLTGANLTGANLSGTNFLLSNMQYANLSKSNLQGAMLQEANMQSAVLRGANLESANMILSDLGNADFQEANLTNAYMDYAATPGVKVQELAETEALANAMELQEKNINAFVRMNGAKINKYTKGINFLWARKNGAVIVAAL